MLRSTPGRKSWIWRPRRVATAKRASWQKMPRGTRATRWRSKRESSSGTLTRAQFDKCFLHVLPPRRSVGREGLRYLRELVAPLFDLCAVVSAPGAPVQPLHSDLGFDGAEAAPLYTCFVALQATPSALGPTEFCLGSHTDADAHAALREGALSREAVPFPLAVGAAVLFDPRIAHRGGPNSSERHRAFLSMTFANPRGSAPVIVPAPGDVLVSEGGISADGGGVWTLRDLRNML